MLSAEEEVTKGEEDKIKWDRSGQLVKCLLVLNQTKTVKFFPF